MSNVLVIDALAAATPPNHSTVTVLGSRFLTYSDPFAFEFVAFEKVPKSAITVHSSPRNVQGRAYVLRYHPQRLCGAGNMYSFPQLPSKWAPLLEQRKCGLPLFEAEKNINQWAKSLA